MWALEYYCTPIFNGCKEIVDEILKNYFTFAKSGNAKTKTDSEDIDPTVMRCMLFISWRKQVR